MGDRPGKPGSRLWRQALTEERKRALASIRTKGIPRNLDEAMAIVSLAEVLTKRYADPAHKPGLFERAPLVDPDPAQDEVQAAQRGLDMVNEWLHVTLEDAKLERHFRFPLSRPDNYPSAQSMAMAVFDGSNFLARHAALGLNGSIWRDQIALIERSRPYIQSLLGESAGQATTADKVKLAVFFGLIALPMAAAAVVAIPELIAAVGAASLSGAFAIPGGVTAVAFLVENYVLAEIVAAFAVGTVVTIANAGSIEGFGEQISTPRGAMQMAGDVILFVIQVRGAPRGGGYARVRTTVVDRKGTTVRVRVESVEEVEPKPAGPARLGNLDLKDMRAMRAGTTLSRGAPPPDLHAATRKSIADARAKHGRDTNTCEAHADHHREELKGMQATTVPSPMSGAHEVTTVMHNGKLYYIDSSIEQFTKSGHLNLAQVRAVDQKYSLGLIQAISDGLFSAQQHQALVEIANGRFKAPM